MCFTFTRAGYVRTKAARVAIINGSIVNDYGKNFIL
jgi:hypothetical protein